MPAASASLPFSCPGRFSLVVAAATSLLGVVLILMSSGCAGYRLGPANGRAVREKSLQVQPFSNATLEPRLNDAVTLELRKLVQRDGTFTLATREPGDIIVSGTITRFNRMEVSFLPRDVVTVQDYRLSLTARVVARDRISGQVIFDKPVTGHTLVRVGSDLVSAERQALSVLAEDLARNITDLLANGSW